MSDEKKTKALEASEKKPYVKPAVQSELIYETLALACTKTTGSACTPTSTKHS